ncbi:MAG: DUF4349 domain-containing protein [Candidatus Nanoarchaeia archaeon]
MGFKDQLTKIKDNWLIAVLILLVVLLVVGGGSTNSIMNNNIMKDSYQSLSYSDNRLSSSGSGGSYSASSYGGSYDTRSDFAPDVSVRKIIKSASISTLVERGAFEESELKLNDIVKASDSFLLSTYSNTYVSGNSEYKTGSYSIKVDTKKYDSVVSQLKQIGEVTSFNENSQDITGSYTNVNIELAAEKERLKRYNELYSSSTIVADKLDLTNKIFDQERIIKYLEESVNNMDERVEYSNVYVTLNEKRSNYANVAVVKFSNLLRSFVGSFNGLLKFVFVVAPWVAAGFVIWLIMRLFRKKEEPLSKIPNNKK